MPLQNFTACDGGSMYVLLCAAVLQEDYHRQLTCTQVLVIVITPAPDNAGSNPQVFKSAILAKLQLTICLRRVARLDQQVLDINSLLEEGRSAFLHFST
jgi:hypothetical protein